MRFLPNAAEFRQPVEVKNAVMGERHLARSYSPRCEPPGRRPSGSSSALPDSAESFAALFVASAGRPGGGPATFTTARAPTLARSLLQFK